MEEFEKQINLFFEELGKNKAMVLSTSLNDKVTSRMMSFVIIDNCFYFQTDRSFRKYGQIKNNPNVSLCIDNIQIEGVCSQLGHPSDNSQFCAIYEKCYKWSYEHYSGLKDERLFMIKPNYIQKWIYEDSQPFVERFYIEEKMYEKIKYTAN